MEDMLHEAVVAMTVCPSVFYNAPKSSGRDGINICFPKKVNIVNYCPRLQCNVNNDPNLSLRRLAGLRLPLDINIDILVPVAGT